MTGTPELQAALDGLERWIAEANQWEQAHIHDQLRANPRHVIDDGRRMAAAVLKAARP